MLRDVVLRQARGVLGDPIGCPGGTHRDSRASRRRACLDHDVGGPAATGSSEAAEPGSQLEHEVELAAREIDERGKQQAAATRRPRSRAARARPRTGCARVPRAVDDHEPAAHGVEDVRAWSCHSSGSDRAPPRPLASSAEDGAPATSVAARAAAAEARSRIPARPAHRPCLRPCSSSAARPPARDDRERRMDRRERLAHALAISANTARVVREAQLALRGMHVHVEAVGGHGEPQCRRGKAAVRQQVSVRLAQRMPEHRVLDPAAVHEETWPSRVARACSAAKRASHAQTHALARRLDQLVRVARSPDRTRAVGDRAAGQSIRSCRRRGKRNATRDGRARSTRPCAAPRELARGRVQELAARGRVEEQLAHLNRGAARARAVPRSRTSPPSTATNAAASSESVRS